MQETEVVNVKELNAMKAKVIETGEIINVYGKYDEGYHTWVYTDVISKVIYRSRELDLSDIIDWEERRFLVAKDVLCAALSNSHPSMHQGNMSDMTKYAIDFADELIKQLKNK